MDERLRGSPLEMHHIRYFLAVAETLNLTKAAERCNVTQPALTRAIKALEGELGGELLRRERALSHLTELGQRMFPMLRNCYETALAAKLLAASIAKSETAPLTVAISHTVPLGRFGPLLRELSRALPGLQLTLRRGSGQEVAECLRSGTAELAIASICVRPCLRGFWGSGIRSPIATNNSRRCVATHGGFQRGRARRGAGLSSKVPAKIISSFVHGRRCSFSYCRPDAIS